VVTLTNTGTATLTVSGSTISGDFAQSNTCGAGVAPSAKCTVTITFTPTTTGNLYGSVTLTDNAAGSPQTITLAGVGLGAPTVSLSTKTLTFAGQSEGTTSAAQTVTVTNSGTAALAITKVAASGDFAETNSCPSSIAAGGTCTINVTFTPGVPGTLSGTLTITDNGAGSPQTVSLGGSGADFSIGISPASLTVAAGTPATFTATITPKSGFDGAVTLKCSGLPPGSTCTVSPSPVTPTGGSVTAMVTVNTAVRGSIPPGRGPGVNWPSLGGLRALPLLVSLLLVISMLLAAASRRRRVWIVLAACTLLAAGLISCGGGTNNILDPTGTPAGTYMVSVSATSGSLSHAVTVPLVVQ
jgi:hypothetical protein